jgi:putative methionine-R-sulfoxide reductase with GAF domain/ABC-type Fe3+-hydroxamate transport system substrate-binding protein
VFHRIVSLAPSATELVLALGAGDRLVAVTRWCKDVCDTGGRPELSDCWSADPAEVLAHRSDLVLGSVPYDPGVTGRLIAAGARLVAMNPARLAGVFQEIEMLGRLLGETESALSLVADFRARLEQVRRLAATTATRPAVYAEAWPSPLISSPPWVADLVEIAGGRFVPAPAGRRVADEEVLAAQPEIIVLAWTNTGDRADPAKVLERPGWTGLPAVRDMRIHAIRDQWLNTPSLILRRGAEALLQVIHPEVSLPIRLETELEQALGEATGRAAMEKAVTFLKNRVGHYNWVGVYVLEGQELVLGPFLGAPSPHVRIPLDKGICGAAVREQQTVIVPDVNADPRYLSCSLETKSEIVVPVFAGGRVVGEIDIDSHTPDAFRDADRQLVERAAALLGARWK